MKKIYRKIKLFKLKTPKISISIFSFKKPTKVFSLKYVKKKRRKKGKNKGGSENTK